MPKKSKADRIVRKRAAEIPAASETDLALLRDAMEGHIDTTEVPERLGPFSRLKRDASGRLPKSPL